MTGAAQYHELQVRLTVIAGYFGIFPEPELLVWLRAVSPGPGKVLVLQPLEPIASSIERTRTFQAEEQSISPEHVSALVSMFVSLGFPGRVPEIEDTLDPEPIWWAHTALEVTLDGVSAHLKFGLGPDGVRGRDAASVKEILQALFECAAVRSDWSDLLVGGTEAAG